VKTNKKIARVIVAFCVLFCTVVVHADAVTDWNAIMQTTVASSNPFFQGRNAAIVQIAVFEAVNTIVGDYEPYLGTLKAPPGASPDAAAIVAAHDALVALYPASATGLDTSKAFSLAAIPDGQSKTDGIAVGMAAASAILALRANDGSGVVVNYAPATNPGDWQPTPPGSAPALLPSWGLVTAVGITGPYRGHRPPAVVEVFGFHARD